MPTFLAGPAEAVLVCLLAWDIVVAGSLGFHIGNACEPFLEGLSAGQPAVSWWRVHEVAPELFWRSSCSWHNVTSYRGPEMGNCALEKYYLISSLLVLLSSFLLRVKLHEPLGSRWLLLLVMFLRIKTAGFFSQKIFAG